MGGACRDSTFAAGADTRDCILLADQLAIIIKCTNMCILRRDKTCDAQVCLKGSNSSPDLNPHRHVQGEAVALIVLVMMPSECTRYALIKGQSLQQ